MEKRRQLIYNIRIMHAANDAGLPCSLTTVFEFAPMTNIVTNFSHLKHEKYSRSTFGVNSVLLGSEHSKCTLNGECGLDLERNFLLPIPQFNDCSWHVQDVCFFSPGVVNR